MTYSSEGRVGVFCWFLANTCVLPPSPLSSATLLTTWLNVPYAIAWCALAGDAGQEGHEEGETRRYIQPTRLFLLYASYYLYYVFSSLLLLPSAAARRDAQACQTRCIPLNGVNPFHRWHESCGGNTDAFLNHQFYTAKFKLNSKRSSLGLDLHP